MRTLLSAAIALGMMTELSVDDMIAIAAYTASREP